MNAQYMALAAQYVALADGKFFSGGDRESRDASQEAKVMAMDTCTCTAVWPMFHFMT
jgi:hypothetical protein